MLCVRGISIAGLRNRAVLCLFIGAGRSEKRSEVDVKTELVAYRKTVKEPKEPMHQWRIFQVWGNNKSFVGIVRARSPQEAVATAIQRFNITDVNRQRRLVAELRRDIP
jgi:hypothetical protein